MTAFKVRLEIVCTAGTSRLTVKEGERPPLLALDNTMPWRERVEGFFRKVLGSVPGSIELRDIRTVDSPEPELRVVVECRLDKLLPTRDDRLGWLGGAPGPALSGGAKPGASLDPEETVNIYTDGGSRGNPGPAGIGVLLSQSASGYEEELSAYLGRATNNVAEYTALIEGLRLAHERGAKKVRHFADSELLVRQLEGATR